MLNEVRPKTVVVNYQFTIWVDHCFPNHWLRNFPSTLPDNYELFRGLLSVRMWFHWFVSDEDFIKSEAFSSKSVCDKKWQFTLHFE